MSKRQIIILLGVWIAIFLFLGFPRGWHKILAIATGLYLIAIAYRLGSDATNTTDIRVPFVEHKAVPTEQAPSSSAVSIESKDDAASENSQTETNQPVA